VLRKIVALPGRGALGETAGEGSKRPFGGGSRTERSRAYSSRT